MTAGAKPSRSIRHVPASIWILGFVSMLMDISSEMIHALLPIYLVNALGASMATVGIIEGIAEATASISKIVSGALSDRLGHRKWLAAAGYGLAAFTRPVFPLAPTLGWLVAARFVDRIGKGIRGAPRDALVADLSPPDVRGASFGLRQSLDTVGAFTGPLLAILLMWATADNFAAVFWIAALPAFLAVALLVAAVREPERPPMLRPVRNPLGPAGIGRLGPAFWWLVVVAGVFTLARFSEAFLILRAQNVGLPIMFTPAVLVAMNVVYTLAAYPAGVISDRIGRTAVLAAGMALLIAACLALALLPSFGGIVLGVALWGLHMGLTQGLMAALVADTAPAELRGTAYGFFNLASGLAMLAASVVAGNLWDLAGPQTTFLAGAGFALVALAGLLTGRRRIGRPAS